jgi:uncharacterized protein YjbI with pentapeptide repeats
MARPTTRKAARPGAAVTSNAKPKTKATPKQMPKPKAPEIDWAGVLRSGPVGVRKWNNLTTAARSEPELTGADLGGCDLSGVNFRHVIADRVSFAGAKMTGAKLASAMFEAADFGGAALDGADLHAGFFKRASFAGADLTRADLRSANLLGADLTGAVLTDAVLDAASFDGETKWPAGFAIPAEVHWTGRGTDPRFSGKGKSAVAVDVIGLITRLRSMIDEKRMKRTMDMLRSGKNQIFSEVEPALVRGIVKSQRELDLVYSCVLTEDGTYACCTPDLQLCMGLRGEPCKHILVLLIGLARAGQLDPSAADRWVSAAKGKNHRWNKKTQNHVSDTLLRYKGVEAGEVDWRPTETIPEDFYAM